MTEGPIYDVLTADQSAGNADRPNYGPPSAGHFCARGGSVSAHSPVRYRRRPPEIEAVELTADNAEQVAAWCGGTVDSDGQTVCITVTQSIIRAYVGDHVARDVDHTGRVSHYPIKRAVLAYCYEPTG